MAVKVQFQIGHTSKLRSKKTVEGFTHDWELYVKGVQQADISAFVEKIIFNLHESFQKPKRVCNKPPYVIQESGYAGFIVFIDIYFRNRDEPKKVQFNYDLDLQQTGPPQHRHDVKTFIFDNPSEEYRQKLLKGGGVPVSGVVGGPAPALNNNLAVIPSTASLNHSPGEGHKPLTSEGKKHKSRPDDGRSNSFANLFGTPITKTTAVTVTAPTKHSPDSKSAVATASTVHQSSSGGNLTGVKEKSSKDKEKSSEKSKERSEKKEKHHKQSLNSPHKEGRSESKKSDSSKHEKRDKTEEKSKKDKNRDKDRERDKDKSSGTAVNNSSSNSKRPTSPKPTREHSPHKSIATGGSSTSATTNLNNTNSLPRPSSSNSGKLEEMKTSSKSSKDSTGEGKSKESKQKESSSSSSGKKSKKEKKDKDKERDKEKRHEEREKQKLAESQQKASAKEDNNKSNNSSLNTNNTNALDKKSSINPLNTNTTNPNHSNEAVKKPEKLSKQEFFKTSDKTALSTITATTNPLAPTASNTNHNSSDKKSSSSSSLNSNANPPEKDKRSHKHKKKEKNKDKDKDRERDKERDKDKDKERDKDKDKDKEGKKEKEAKEKHTDDNSSSAKVLPSTGATPVNVNSTEEPAINNASSSIAHIGPYPTTAAINSNSSSTSSSTKSSKNKDKKSKDKSKEEKLKHKSNDLDSSESKAKQAKISSSNSTHTSSSLSTSSSSSSVSTTIANAATVAPHLTPTPATSVITANNAGAETKMNLDLSDTESLPAASMQAGTAQPNDSNATIKPSLRPASPIITHSDSSNSSFPDLPLRKQPQQSAAKPVTSQERPKTFTAPTAVAPPPLLSPAPKEPPKINKPTTNVNKDKPVDKPPKEEEKEKKRRRNSQAVNTFIEPPLKQLKTKEPTKSVREKSKSPSLRKSGSRASISAEASTTFLQPSASPSSTAAAAPLPPPSSAPSAAHSPALSATEAVGNATSATANAATCNSNSTPSSTTNSTALAPPHHLPLDYLSELQELHHKIMTLQDNEDLQHVVELIAATGCYEITTKTFDFDLCKLDRGTVQRLQEFFATSVS